MGNLLNMSHINEYSSQQHINESSNMLNDNSNGPIPGVTNVLSDYNLSAMMEQKRSKGRLRELQKHIDMTTNGIKRSSSNTRPTV